MISAFTGFGASALSFAIELQTWAITVFIAVAAGLTALFSKNKDIMIWNTEIIMIYSLFLGLITYILFIL